MSEKMYFYSTGLEYLLAATNYETDEEFSKKTEKRRKQITLLSADDIKYNRLLLNDFILRLANMNVDPDYILFIKQPCMKDSSYQKARKLLFDFIPPEITLTLISDDKIEIIETTKDSPFLDYFNQGEVLFTVSESHESISCHVTDSDITKLVGLINYKEKPEGSLGLGKDIIYFIENDMYED